jgi:kinesin family member 1
LENCARPAIITKDLSMIIYGRDARIGPRSLKHLFSGSYRNPEANRLSGIYELSLRRANEAGSPGRSLIAWFCSRFSIKHEINSKFL